MFKFENGSFGQHSGCRNVCVRDSCSRRCPPQGSILFRPAQLGRNSRHEIQDVALHRGGTIFIAVLLGLSVGLVVWRQMMKKYSKAANDAQDDFARPEHVDCAEQLCLSCDYLCRSWNET
jgi:hypothetical protein